MADALDAEAQPAARLFERASASLVTAGVAVVDDIDLTCAPRNLGRSRTMVETLKGSSSVYQWGADPTVPRVLKALVDASSGAVVNGEKPHTLIFSSVEECHEAFLQPPLVVVLGAPTVEDYAALLASAGGAGVDAAAIFALHGELSSAELRAAVARAQADSKAPPTTATVLQRCGRR